MNIKNARIAVIVSTYNWPEALTLSVMSIFRQTELPAEIVIADDGSGDETRAAIETLKKESPRPIKHVWQEDRGFRKSEILNEAIAVTNADYIIQIDGDCILEKHFVEDHMAVAKQKCYVCGCRVKLNEGESKAFAERQKGGQSEFSVGIKNPYFLNSLRIPPLRFIMQWLHRIRSKGQIRGCNIAFWRSDLIEVNGYNEDFQGYGAEDFEVLFRMKAAGCEMTSLRFGGICYHLHHKELSRDRWQLYHQMSDRINEENGSWCKNGLDRHLKRD